MGMFDSFYNMLLTCPKCGQDLSGEEFQTKDLDCILTSYHFPCYVNDQLNYFHIYASCPKCDIWFEPKVILNKGFTIRLETDDDKILWEIDPIDILIKISNEREYFRQESRHRKSFGEGLAAFIWKHHKNKRGKLSELLKENLNESKGDFEQYTIRSCYNPGSYIAGIIGGPQNYCWILEDKSHDQTLREGRIYGKRLRKLSVGKERTEMVNALVWIPRKGIVEK